MRSQREANTLRFHVPVGILLLSIGLNGVVAGEPKVEMVGSPDYRAVEMKPRGAEYQLTHGDMYQRTMWGWQIELPDGSGIRFGGIASWTHQEINGQIQRSDDPCVRTQILQDGKWIFIHEELRKKNPLQPLHERIRNLRTPLKFITSQARHTYFEGRDEAVEKAYIEKEITPRIVELNARLSAAQEALNAVEKLDEYASIQKNLALARLEQVAPVLAALGSRSTHENLKALRLARICIEQAAEYLDAEPPARAMSMLAHDAKSGLFVLFGGDHLDYLQNDLWVFDPAQRRWQQRHTKIAPEPRGDHVLTGDGSGKISMRGGYTYNLEPTSKGWASTNYVSVGPGDWSYDVASNTWTSDSEAESFSSGTRTYRTSSSIPDWFTEGARPNASAHEELLKELPVNTWVDLQPKKFSGSREWGTLGYDASRDMIYFYNGGHSSYSGSDVVHYHLSTNHWDQLVETEFPLNWVGASGSSAPGWSFNRRPWITNHLWNSYKYHPGLRKLMVAGRFTSSVFPRGMGQPDENTYLYDPDYGDWEKRVPSSVSLSCMSAQLLWVPNFGMLEWGRWRFDEAQLDWKKLEPKSNLPDAGIDFCGLVHDPKRNRVLYFSGGYYTGEPYSGEVFAMAMPSLEVTSFKPDGSEHIRGLYPGKENSLGTWILREVVYHPGMDMFIFSSHMAGEYTAALDVKNNRWVGLKIPGPHPYGLSSAYAYDEKRDLIYSVGTRADVSVLRLDPQTLEIKSLAEIAELTAQMPPPVKK